MTSIGATRLSLGHLVGQALETARSRWATLLILLVSIDWGPRMALYLSRVHHYDPSSHDPARFTQFASQSILLALASLVMQASAIAAGLAIERAPRTAFEAFGHVLRRAPRLAPWWLIALLPTAAALWIDWRANSYADVDAITLWRLLGSTGFAFIVDLAVGLYSMVALVEDVSIGGAFQRTLRIMAGRRTTVFVVAFSTDLIGLLINLATPFLAATAQAAGLGDFGGWILAASTSSFIWEAASVVSNLVFVELYRELARAHDGLAPGELSHVFA